MHSTAELKVIQIKSFLFLFPSWYLALLGKEQTSFLTLYQLGCLVTTTVTKTHLATTAKKKEETSQSHTEIKSVYWKKR